MTDSIRELKDAILRFRDEREWAQFHTPRNLATALGIEVAELQELTLWKADDEIVEFLANLDHRQLLADEIADILIYALLLSEAIDVDPGQAILNKLEQNSRKYPIHLARGNSKKYTELTDDNL